MVRDRSGMDLNRNSGPPPVRPNAREISPRRASHVATVSTNRVEIPSCASLTLGRDDLPVRVELRKI